MRTIDVGPKQLTCITTSAKSIIAACEDIVNIYDAVTFVLQQSLHIPKAATKIQASPDESVLYLSHSSSVTMWDVQTGGLIYTFTARSKINDFVISPTGDHIACGLSDGLVTFWNIHTKKGKGFGNGQPVVAIIWLSPQELVVATQNSIYIHNVSVWRTSSTLPISGHVWGMVQLANEDLSSSARDKDTGGIVRDKGEDEDSYGDADEGSHEGELLVGTSLLDVGVGQELCSLRIIKCGEGHLWIYQQPCLPLRSQSQMYLGQLLHPVLVGKQIVCITPPSGVQSFNTTSCNLANNPLLLDAAISVAVSRNTNLVVQTKDSIQIFSTDILMSGKSRNDVHPSHIYPLGENHIACILQPNRHLTLLKLETLQELRPDNNTSPLGALLTKKFPSACASVSRGLVAEFGISVVIQAWQLGTPLPKWTEVADEDEPLGGISPECTRIVTVYGSPQRELHVKDAKDRTILAKLPLGYDPLGMGRVYNLTFDSETRFYLKIDILGKCIQIPYDIIALSSGQYSHTITRGEPVPLSESRTTPPYTLDASCEWVLDANSRKVCWIPPENIRRGNGGHFWAGLSLVMVGIDGIVRKLVFKDPDC